MEQLRLSYVGLKHKLMWTLNSLWGPHLRTITTIPCDLNFFTYKMWPSWIIMFFFYESMVPCMISPTSKYLDLGNNSTFHCLEYVSWWKGICAGFIIEHIFMFKLQRKWEESIKQEASVFFTGRGKWNLMWHSCFFHCLAIYRWLEFKSVLHTKWVETGKEILQRRGERTEGKRSGEGRKLEDYKNPPECLSSLEEERGRARRERKEEGKWKRRKRREGEKDCKLHWLSSVWSVGLWFRASSWSIGWPKKSFGFI